MSELERLRADIEHIDRVLIRLISTRVRVARRAGKAKQAASVPITDPAQEATVLNRAVTLAREMGLPVQETRELFLHIVELARSAELES